MPASSASLRSLSWTLALTAMMGITVNFERLCLTASHVVDIGTYATNHVVSALKDKNNANSIQIQSAVICEFSGVGGFILFLLIFLLPDATQKSVLNVFDTLTKVLGLELFRSLFQVILTDYAEEKTMPKFLITA